MVGAELSDVLVLSGWTPWGPLPQPNAYFTYDGEAERTKEWAIHCHASQVLLTDYTEYCSHLGRAYAALTREWAEGHSLAGRAHRKDERFVGVELFQIESYDPSRCQAYPPDPIQLALGSWADISPPARPMPGRRRATRSSPVPPPRPRPSPRSDARDPERQPSPGVLIRCIPRSVPSTRAACWSASPPIRTSFASSPRM